MSASQALPVPLPSDPSGELDERRAQALRGLANLSQQLLGLRTALVLPGSDDRPPRKRRRSSTNDEELGIETFLDDAQASLDLADM